MGQRTSVYLDADLAAALKASDAPRAELIRRGLGATASAPAPAQAPVPAGPLVLAADEPCSGAACSGPGCWNRDTARYGLRSLPLCPACRAALQGRTYQREVPESAARAIRRGAA
jgi:hypothetical protein